MDNDYSQGFSPSILPLSSFDPRHIDHAIMPGKSPQKYQGQEKLA